MNTHAHMGAVTAKERSGGTQMTPAFRLLSSRVTRRAALITAVLFAATAHPTWGQTPIRISPGGPYTDSRGQVWSAEYGYLHSLRTNNTSATNIAKPKIEP